MKEYYQLIEVHAVDVHFLYYTSYAWSPNVITTTFTTSISNPFYRVSLQSTSETKIMLEVNCLIVFIILDQI
jgi:hypothetical protein